MGKYLNRLIGLVLIFAVASVRADSTDDDSVRNLPAPTKKSNWKASAFAGCALVAVVGGIFAICWSGGGNTPKCSQPQPNPTPCPQPTCCPPQNCFATPAPCPQVCPNPVTADCMAGSCIYHAPAVECNNGCTNGGWNGQQQVINGPPPCNAVNGGVPPF